MKNIKYIGVAGYARSGKNLFCDIASKQLSENYNLTSKTFALAYELKMECGDFIKEKLNLDVFSEKTEDKNRFRPMLVWYADVKRTESEGRHWLECVNRRMKDADSDIVFISDVRFSEYPKDEIYWIKNELNGKLVHIDKFTYGFPTDGRVVRVKNDLTKKIYTDAPNITESINNPKIKKVADYVLEWEHVDVNQDLLNNEYLNKCVRECLTAIL